MIHIRFEKLSNVKLFQIVPSTVVPREIISIILQGIDGLTRFRTRNAKTKKELISGP